MCRKIAVLFPNTEFPITRNLREPFFMIAWLTDDPAYSKDGLLRYVPRFLGETAFQRIRGATPEEAVISLQLLSDPDAIFLGDFRSLAPLRKRTFRTIREIQDLCRRRLA